MTTRFGVIALLSAVGILVALPNEQASSISIEPISVVADKQLSAHTLPLPVRPEFALTGSQFLRATDGFTPPAREAAIMREIRSGNIPSHLRELVPVKVRQNGHLATVYVTPDYLAIGSDDDYVIIPMAPRTAMSLARDLGFTLPTKKLVDDIYQSSPIHLTPQPLPPGPAMTSNTYYQKHDAMIKSQLKDQNYPARPHLLAGHKKDVVLTPRLVLQPSRVAIYGWHRPNGKPIQPLSLVHGIEYVDYSHGVRFISRKATVDGVELDLSQILTDQELNSLVSDEGQVSVQSYL